MTTDSHENDINLLKILKQSIVCSFKIATVIANWFPFNE